MTELIHFNTKERLDEKNFELSLADTFKAQDFFWTSDIYSYAAENEVDTTKTYISLDISESGFKYHYTVLARDAIEISLKNKIQFLKILSANENIEILSSDDEVAPFSWVLIEPDGQTSTVQTKMADNLIIDDFYNFPYGDFRTTQPLTDQEKTILKRIFKSGYPNILIEYSTDGPVVNGDFNKVKDNYENLKYFDHHYEIRPLGKNEWIDRVDKSTQFLLLMQEFQREVQNDLCVFPRNFSEVKNIEGGSDSEEHCILLTAFRQEKIIFKQRRKSWVS